MTTNPVRNARWLLDRLEDPFMMFPVESVSDRLFEAVGETEMRKSERMGPWGVARKFWSVEEEHYHQEIGLLIGAIFVLGQAAVTQTVSILSELRRHPEAQSVIPEHKGSRLGTHAPTETRTKLSEIVLINAVGNYFKHVYEWPERWDIVPTKGSQAETIEIVLQLGMTPGEMTDNLLLAASTLGLHSGDPRALAKSIQDWQWSWARMLYPLFGLHDPTTED